MLKIVFNFRKKKLPKCFDQYFQPVVQVHNYPTRFAENSLAVVRSAKYLLKDQYDILEVNFGMKCLKN